MICKDCGKPIPDGEKKCPNCGLLVEQTVNSAVEKVESNPAPAPAVPEKKNLYKAADIDPERPSYQFEEEKPVRRKTRRAPIVNAAIWILAVLAVLAIIFVIGRVVSNSKGNDDVTENSTQEENPSENTDEQKSSADRQTPDMQESDDQSADIVPVPEEKPVYDIRGTWKWESEAYGFRDTYWVFSGASQLDIFIAGFIYEYDWPTGYTYDENTYVLSLTDEAMGLAWIDENTFVCGSGKAYRVDESEIPADAVNVADLEPLSVGPQVVEDEYLLPDSASKYLTKEDLADIEPDMLRFARNEIFARHGRMFSDEELQNYFNDQSWYNGYIKPTNFNSSVLNDYERYNAAFISKYEESLKN